MLLHGLGKLTLLDYPEHLACTAFTGACNFRCPFCHNASLVLTPDLCEHISEEEFFTFLQSRKGKLEGVCITGGEPTLQPDLEAFISHIKELGYLVKLDTNGYRPEVLERLLSQQLLDFVAMDIKNCPSCYAKTAGISADTFRLSEIEASIRLLLRSGLLHEFRTTVVKELHTPENMRELGLWITGLSPDSSNICNSSYYLQNFKSGDGLICGNPEQFHSCSDETLDALILAVQPYLPKASVRGQ